MVDPELDIVAKNRKTGNFGPRADHLGLVATEVIGQISYYHI